MSLLIIHIFGRNLHAPMISTSSYNTIRCGGATTYMVSGLLTFPEGLRGGGDITVSANSLRRPWLTGFHDPCVCVRVCYYYLSFSKTSFAD